MHVSLIHVKGLCHNQDDLPDYTGCTDSPRNTAASASQLACLSHSSARQLADQSQNIFNTAAYTHIQIAPLEADGTAGGTSCGPSGFSLGRTFSVNSSAYLPGSGEPSDGPCRQKACKAQNTKSWMPKWTPGKRQGSGTSRQRCFRVCFYQSNSTKRPMLQLAQMQCVLCSLREHV